MLPTKNGEKTITTPPGNRASQPGSAEEKIAELKKSLEFTQKKLQIVGSVTRHDVLNQLTAIVGYTDLLLMMVQDPKLKSFIEKENHAIARIQRQFRFSKDFQNIAVESPIWQILKDIVHQESEEISLGSIHVSDETGMVSVYADPLFPKVIFNLFDNTVRHAGSASEIHIAIRRVPGFAVLIVEDNGAGIPLDEKEKIFERGFGKDTGWGLFLAREILAGSGMTITETGEPGKGARFEIMIPEEKFRMD